MGKLDKQVRVQEQGLWLRKLMSAWLGGRQFSRGFHRRFIVASHGDGILAVMKAPGMNRSAALFLQGLVILLGLVVLGLMLWEPHREGRNAHATPFEIYFHDPFLAYVYAGSLPFFLALVRAFGMLGHVRRDGAFSRATVDALRAIQRQRSWPRGGSCVAGGW